MRYNEKRKAFCYALDSPSSLLSTIVEENASSLNNNAFITNNLILLQL